MVGPVPRRPRPDVRPLRPRVAATALVVGGLAVVAGVGCSPGYSAEPYPSAMVGRVFPALLGDGIVGDVTTVVLPGVVYEVELSRPQGTADSASTDEAGVDVSAADGTAFVAVAWDPRASQAEGPVLAGTGPDVSPQISVTAGDQTYPVGAMDEEGQHASWVVIPADAGPVGVAVEFDGLTQQVVDMTDPQAVPAGGSPLLYGPSSRIHQPPCPDPAEDPEAARYAFSRCTLMVSDPVPYHEDLGWAEPGRAWVVARLTVAPIVVGWDDPGTGGAVVDYEVPTHDDVAVTLDGQAPADVVPVEPDEPAGLQDDGTWSGDAVFDVSQDLDAFEVAFARPYTAVPEDPDEARADGTPAELTGTYEATVPIA